MIRRHAIAGRIATAAVVVLAALGIGVVRASAAGVSGSDAASAPSRTPSGEGEDVYFVNRRIVTFRAAVQGTAPTERARAARRRLEALPADAGADAVKVSPLVLAGERGYAVGVGEDFVFAISEQDADPGEKLETLAKEAAQRLSDALAARREQRRLPVILRGVALSVTATVVLAGFFWLLVRVRRRLTAQFIRITHDRVAGLAKRGLELEGMLISIVHVALRILLWTLVAAALDVWLTFVLGCFPFTRPWSRALSAKLLGLLAEVGLAIIGYIPSLAMLAVIFVIARSVAGLLKRLLERVAREGVVLTGLHPETVGATRRIAVAFVWLVALAAAFPYVPGAGSEAFKGLSLLIGLMISLGSSGVVAQAMSGLVIVYSRSLSKGDVVRVGETEGVVSEVGILSTKMISMRGEEVTVPNTVVVAGPVRNFSRLSRDKGPLVSTVVSIGYDAPWRRVRALLLASARRTSGLRPDSEPFVLQRGLGDFYVTYELFARLVDPMDRPQVLDELHGHIQDAFNEAGVQIMSPHFMDQPPQPVVVPPGQWGANGGATGAPGPGERGTG